MNQVIFDELSEILRNISDQRINDIRSTYACSLNFDANDH